MYIHLETPKELFPKEHTQGLDALTKNKLRSTFQKIQQKAESKTPVRKGTLRKGYRVNISGNFPNIQASIGNVVPYFRYVEYGTGDSFLNLLKKKGQKTTKRPGVFMLTNSIDEYKDELENVQESVMSEFLELLR